MASFNGLGETEYFHNCGLFDNSFNKFLSSYFKGLNIILLETSCYNENIFYFINLYNIYNGNRRINW